MTATTTKTATKKTKTTTETKAKTKPTKTKPAKPATATVPLGQAWKLRQGFRFSAEQAKRYGPELARHTEVKGSTLSASQILDAGRSTTSPIHDAFTWDDSEAAHRCRLAEATYLGRAFTIRIERRDGKPAEARSMYYLTDERSDEEKEGGGSKGKGHSEDGYTHGDRPGRYHSWQDVMADPVSRAQVLVDQRRTLKAIIDNLGPFEEADEARRRLHAVWEADALWGVTVAQEPKEPEATEAA